MVTRMPAKSNPLPLRGPPSGWAARLSSTRFVRADYVATTGSTNADLVDRASHALDGTVLIADYQSAGRGRLERRWDAPPGTNLLVSVLVRPDWGPENHPLITSALAVALVDALVDFGIKTAIKWPNDVVVADPSAGSGKLGGILAEYVAGPPPAVIVGLGVNLAWPRADDDRPIGATSLEACGYQVDRWDLLARVLIAFDTRLAELAGPDGLARLREAHLGRSATVGRRVRADGLAGEVVGTAIDLSLEGELIVEPEGSGKFVDSVAISVADVVHLRAI